MDNEDPSQENPSDSECGVPKPNSADLNLGAESLDSGELDARSADWNEEVVDEESRTLE